MGPAELLVLTFPQQTITVEAATALGKPRTGGDVRVIDSLVVTRHPDGEATYGELADFEDLRGVVPDGPAGVPDIADKLSDPGRPAQQGLLTPEEFATAKARLLGG
ncbi:hypothetical protein [Kitasatospora sp. NPDC058218]|uniref:hypothetical protein n=1 Tax=Kitasatospora sp. NPDC058218 TaxID=3346385 RepID=UPI0036D8920B